MGERERFAFHEFFPPPPIVPTDDRVFTITSPVSLRTTKSPPKTTPKTPPAKLCSLFGFSVFGYPLLHPSHRPSSEPIRSTAPSHAGSLDSQCQSPTLSHSHRVPHEAEPRSRCLANVTFSQAWLLSCWIFALTVAIASLRAK